MPTARENATAGLSNALARLAEMDATPLTTGGVRMTYTDGGQTYGWNEYRAALLEQICKFEETLKALQASEGPFEVQAGDWPGWGWW